MKKYLPIIAIILVLVVGLGILLYPLVSSMINNIGTRNEANAYREITESMDDSQLEKLFDQAYEYNDSLINTVILTDPFDEESYEKIGARYEETFNIDGKGLIGYVDIPKINVYLPIYHGTSTDVLSKGAGHLDNTSLPVGGDSTHCVISAHSAFPTETFFDYLEDMEEGDTFYIHVLNKTLKYEVDQIKVVEPTDTSDLYIIRGEDHVTLLTCTPYSLNTHRLLVRGNRVEFSEDSEDYRVRTFSTGGGYMYFLGYRVSYTVMAISIAAFLVVVATVVIVIIMLGRRKPGKESRHMKKDS